jgi:dihydrofolate reductase
MTNLTLDISMSLDGFIAGPNRSLEQPLGEGGLHQWASAVASFRARHGNTGATVMGRRMFSGGAGPWADDPNADAWWGDDPPFHHPVFVLTHHARAPVTKQGGTTFTFVTDGLEAGLERARAVAGHKDVVVGGGANLAQQCIDARLLDELQIHLLPVLLGGGVRLFEKRMQAGRVELERTRVLKSPTGVTHLTYRIAK